MTNPNGALWDQEAERQDSGARPPLSALLTRRSDGRWTQGPREGHIGGAWVFPEPATTELAVTRARVETTDVDWDLVDSPVDGPDPAVDQTGNGFFEMDPGRRASYEHLLVDESDPDPVAGDPGASGPFRSGAPATHGSAPPGSTGPGYPAGSGYEAVYGDAVVDPEEPNVDDDELAMGAAARRNAIEWAVVLVAAVLLALVLRALVLQAFYIPSPSMQETLLIQDRVLVNKLSYRFGEVGQGDIVVFQRTDEEIASAGPNQPKDVIKRVIARGGETIEIRDNTVFINDVELDEPYLQPGVVMPDFGPLTVPEGFLFVMGDNRNLSSDSRGELGPIADDRVVGRAFVLFWPLNRLDIL